jgi:hypothetical protein
MKTRRVYTVLAMTCAMLWPAAAYSETFSDKFAKDCPNGNRIVVLQRQVDDAQKKLADTRFTLAGELSQEYYFCSIAVADPYVRDATAYLTSSDLWLSNHTNGDALKNDPGIISDMNALVAVTKFSDIRTAASKLKTDVIADFAKVNATVFGPAGPRPTASER